MLKLWHLFEASVPFLWATCAIKVNELPPIPGGVAIEGGFLIFFYLESLNNKDITLRVQFARSWP